MNFAYALHLINPKNNSFIRGQNGICIDATKYQGLTTMLLQKICRQLLSSTQHCLVNSKSKHLKEACTGIQCLKKYHSVTTMKPLHNISTSWIRRTVSIVSVRTFHDSATFLRLSERTRYINRSGNVRKKKRRLRSQVCI